MAKLLDLYALIDESIGKLDELLLTKSVDEVLRDYYLQNAVLHILQVAVQALIDMASHLLSELGVKPPSYYREIPAYLENLGVLSGEEAVLMQKMIGFRNIVVHGYSRISLEIIRRILVERKYHDIGFLANKMLDYARRKGVDCG